MNKTKQMTQTALFIVLYIIGSKITLPLGIIPFTLQTCVVFLAGCLLMPKQIFTSFTIFLGLGFLGLPLFSQGGGVAYLLKPSCGFLLAFPFAAAFIAYCRTKWQLNKVYQLFPICLLALFMIYTIGSIYMYFILHVYVGSNIDLHGVLAAGVLPFIISDGVSSFLACLCAVRMYPALHAYLNIQKTPTHES